MEYNYFDPEKCIKLELSNYAVLILNQPIDYPKSFFIPFWNKASVRITADGGTNRWFKYIAQNDTQLKISKIDIVSGDFDSIKEENLKRAVDEGAEMIETENQDETDFTKALRVISEHSSNKNIKINQIFVICQSSGRIDQIISNIHTLYKIDSLQLFHNVTVCLFSYDSFTWLLRPGKHSINVAGALKKSKNAWCALIPMGEESTDVTTTGLKWNLDKDAMSFKTLISTSNTYDGSDYVTVENKTDLLWCMGVLPLLSSFYGTLDEEK